MLGDLRTAQRQFEENVRLLGPNGHNTDPERFNLYMGLANIAAALNTLAAEVAELRSAVATLRRTSL